MLDPIPIRVRRISTFPGKGIASTKVGWLGRCDYFCDPCLTKEVLNILFPVRFLPRMKPPMGLLEVSPIEVGIDLRRRDIRMSQHRLN